jgi:7,8-dihydropterin-6-yl-methyl-4-(beta-D-ribofuranosyl)aminobenzene 5'-phosphate synthase
MSSHNAQITTLVNNQAVPELLAEHGLSFWIESEGLRILFDTGSGETLMENAQQLGIPLDKTDVIVLSHGHYDHTGGLAEVLKSAPSARLVMHPNAKISRYSVHDSEPPRPIGMPPLAQAAIDRRNPSFAITWSTHAVSLSTTVGVTGPIPRRSPFEDVGGPFFLDQQGQKEDPLLDDQALWIRTPRGLVVCVGCCHAGIVNTLNHVCRLSGVSSVYAVLGGFHLLQANEERLRLTMNALSDISPEILAPCHCTGDMAIHTLKETFQERVVPCEAGTEFQF